MTATPDEVDEVLVTEIREAYAGAAEAWAAGPSMLYRRLAGVLVTAEADRLAGRLVLDLGSGTGVASEVLTTIGARTIGLDLAVEMLAHRRETRPPGVAGDARSLPFRDGAFDAVVAAFSLNHVPDLSGSLRECRRVLRPGGRLMASTFPVGPGHPAKEIVEDVLERYGYRRPDWYETFKARIAAYTGDAERFAQTARSAGFGAVDVDEIVVDAGLDDSRRAADWRLSMPHTLAFVSALDPATRAHLHDDAWRALGEGLPSSVSMLVLRAETV
jgi:ubiquinone/menaquinone biosynthesis C-methylase UbiE